MACEMSPHVCGILRVIYLHATLLKNPMCYIYLSCALLKKSEKVHTLDLNADGAFLISFSGAAMFYLRRAVPM